MKRYTTILFLLFISAGLFAQQTVFEEGETVYSKETAGGVLLHSNSWGINFYKAKYLTGFSKLQYHFEIVGMKSQRQYKTPIGGDNYYYGKLNSMLILRTSLGYMKEFIPKQSLKGVSISYVVNAGLSSAVVKPVFLKIEKENRNIVDERYDPNIHSTNNIRGKSNPLVGIEETKYHPGLFLRGALNFDYGGKSSSVRAIEVGLAADIYPDPIALMAYENPHYYFLTAFVSLQFGSRKFDGQTKENTPDFE